MSLEPWILASRPKTLPAALAPVLVGTALAWNAESFQWLPALICLLFALLIQIATNFANDYFDFTKGADKEDRVGPTRAVAAGLIKPATMKTATAIIFAIAFCVGLALIPFGGWWLLAVGVSSILCGYAYTAGPIPLAYVGLGDVFVLVFFGLVAVCCTFYVQTGHLMLEVILVSTAVGGLSTNLLVVNNLRDVDTDRRANKKTLAVPLGKTFSLWEYRMFLLWAFGVVGWLSVRLDSFWLLLSFLAFPFSVSLWFQLPRAKTGGEFNQLLAKTALVLVLFSITLSAGLLV